MAEIKHILAIYDPTRHPKREEQPAVSKAARLARALGARLEIFLCDYDQYLSGERFFDSPGLQKARDAFIEYRHKTMERLANELAGDGIEVTTDSIWDTPLSDGIVRKVLRDKPDLVVKDAHHHPALQRAIFTNTDWHLVRDCPARLLLVKQPEGVRDGPVLAAVDPMHDNDKPARLDDDIVHAAGTVASALGLDMHLFHAFHPISTWAGSIPGAPEPISLPVDITDERIREAHDREFVRLRKKHSIPADRAHLREGDTAAELFDLIDKSDASMVVTGAVARGLLQRVFVGSTAEKVLGEIICDVLIVKPPDFESTVKP